MNISVEQTYIVGAAVARPKLKHGPNAGKKTYYRVTKDNAHTLYLRCPDSRPCKVQVIVIEDQNNKRLRSIDWDTLQEIPFEKHFGKKGDEPKKKGVIYDKISAALDKKNDLTPNRIDNIRKHLNFKPTRTSRFSSSKPNVSGKENHG